VRERLRAVELTTRGAEWPGDGSKTGSGGPAWRRALEIPEGGEPRRPGRVGSIKDALVAPGVALVEETSPARRSRR
jgi:hypothetical protein